MISPSIDEVKAEVDDEITAAYKEFCKNKVKQLKASIHAAQEKEAVARNRTTKLVDELNNLDIAKLREEFFEVNVMHQESPYEAALKN